MNKNPVERFWKKVDKSAGPEACWPCRGWKDRDGYVRYGRKGIMGERLAHRLAWTLTNGEIPGGLSVLHRCDNPPCCNPAHLFTGTQADNMSDMNAKGRRLDNRGEKHYKTKLSENDVRYIRATIARGGRGASARMCGEFRLASATISNINTRATWSSVQ